MFFFFTGENPYSEVPPDMLRNFYKIDIQLYSILVFELGHDPILSARAIALWIWLEQVDFANVVAKILSLSINLINGLADEALVCHNCIKDPLYIFSCEESKISLTKTLLGNPFSLNYLHENRVKALCGIKMVAEKVCVKAFRDLIEIAMINQRNYEQFFSNSTIIHNNNNNNNNYSHNNKVYIPRDKRTMFVTFSKGFPVFEMELREFFTNMFGHCVESISMQNVKPNEQSLFANIVFINSVIVDLILNGLEKAKFNVKGKHVWLRRFVQKHHSNNNNINNNNSSYACCSLNFLPNFMEPGLL